MTMNNQMANDQTVNAEMVGMRPAFAPLARPTVALVVNTFNDGHYLADALDSARRQTRPFDEIVVVDDGSRDGPAPLLSRYPEARLITQSNMGLAAARNTGLRAVESDFIVFLDADDVLLPNAVEKGLAAHDAHPAAGLVYGAHRRIAADGSSLGGDIHSPIEADAYGTLLTRNCIGMHAAVMYHRERLVAIGGFDPGLRRCEDYDVYLRMADAFPVSSHPGVVAEYRRHDGNMSLDQSRMLKSVLLVHDRQRAKALSDPLTARRWAAGRRIWRDYYANCMLQDARRQWSADRDAAALIRGVTRAVLTSPRHAIVRAGRFLAKRLHERFRLAAHSLWLRHVGATTPISLDFGHDRGTAIDRYYVEGFLARNAALIHGRVLEVGDDSYSRRFGASIDHQDILHVHAGNDMATLVGDISAPGTLPEAAFDCLVLTQTLHLIFDLKLAVERIHTALKPGGSALVTVPGISQIDRGEWGASWFWSLTEASARRLFDPVFGAGNVTIEVHGNVFSATAFLQGLALEEVDRRKLDVVDRAYPVIIAICARKDRNT